VAVIRVLVPVQDVPAPVQVVDVNIYDS
jgi:hypothetical protein